MNKILLAMSGGTDSSTAASILLEEGFGVYGVTMKFWGKGQEPRSTCGSPADVLDAAMTARKLGIEHTVIDFSREYEKLIENYFKREYTLGRTPNPCTYCNRHIKFQMLPERAAEMGIGFDFFATGHYANVYVDPVTLRYGLKKARDRSKDQTYFLSFLTQKQLSRTIFPLGKYLKTDVREIAEQLSLTVAFKKDSQDFKGARDFRNSIGGIPGNFVDPQGNTLGRHKGIEHFTIGQRKGLGISAREPLYVIKIDVGTHDITLGPQEYLYCSEFTVESVNMMTHILKAGESMNGQVKIRSGHSEASASITRTGKDTLRIAFHTPQKSVTPGQTAVVYRNDVVVASGIIQ